MDMQVLTKLRGSPAQQKQRRLWMALGYSIAIRGYLRCWQALLRSAGIQTGFHGRIEEMIECSKRAEQVIRIYMQAVK
jgi:hypothetical protein